MNKIIDFIDHPLPADRPLSFKCPKCKSALNSDIILKSWKIFACTTCLGNSAVLISFYDNYLFSFKYFRSTVDIEISFKNKSKNNIHFIMRNQILAIYNKELAIQAIARIESMSNLAQINDYLNNLYLTVATFQ